MKSNTKTHMKMDMNITTITIMGVIIIITITKIIIGKNRNIMLLFSVYNSIKNSNYLIILNINFNYGNFLFKLNKNKFTMFKQDLKYIFEFF